VWIVVRSIYMPTLRCPWQHNERGGIFSEVSPRLNVIYNVLTGVVLDDVEGRAVCGSLSSPL